ncbi:MAG: hypothetical protein R3A44_04995 [Caldilineaceae bacterium]
MAVSMLILGWKAEGLRCPDHEIDFCDAHGHPHRVSLLQMPNGTGKTTTLTLLRAALSGAAETSHWSPSSVRELRKRNALQERGKFELRLRLNQKLVTIIMEFDFVAGRIQYKTTEGQGQKNRFAPPVEFRRFMNENFVNFYIFDGELAQNLLDHEHTNAESVVEHLFQVHLLKDIRAKVSSYWDEKTKNVSAKDTTGLTRRRNRVYELEQRFATLTMQQKRLEERYKALEKQLFEQEQAYTDALEKDEQLSQRVHEAEKRVQQLANEVRTHSLALLDNMADPHALSTHFATAIFDLKAALDRVKLPESAAREFFEELAHEEECICGRPIDEEIRSVIQTRARQYMGSDNVALLNTMKTAINDAVGQSRTEPEAHLRKRIDELDQLVLQQRQATQLHNQLRNEAEEADPEVKKVRAQIEKLKTDLHDCKRELEKFDVRDDSDTSTNIKTVNRRLETAKKDLAEVTNTIELKAKRDILHQVLESAYTLARQNLATEICHDANQRIMTLMPDNHIRIERIDKCLVLEGQAGGSVGEQLSIAYAFLSTLFNRSDQQLPFVVDSPAGAIDLATRRRISKLVPNLSRQFIAFTISAERQDFVPNLKEATNGSMQCITLFRKGAAELETAARATPAYKETVDGMLVEEEVFFNAFHLDEEVL